MDLDVVMKSNECPCIVQFYGALFKEVSGVTTFDKNELVIDLKFSFYFYRGIVGFVWNLWIPL